MKRFILILAMSCSMMTLLKAQPIPVIEDRETAILKPLRLSGPRVGVSYIPGLKNTDISNVIGSDSSSRINADHMYQFGWQFEWKYFETIGGSAGLFEVVPMVGGFEHGLIIPSVSMLVGYRDASGLELGAGPNVSTITTGFVLAAGYTFQSKHMNFPVTFGYIPTKEGARFSLLFGFTKRSSRDI